MREDGLVSYVFEQFRLDRGERRLFRDGDPVPLEPKSFDLLSFLVEHPGRLVTKQELVDAVWSRASVSDNSLTRCVHQVRSALRDHADRPKFIETVPGSGYRFIAKVTTEENPQTRDVSVGKRNRSRLRWIAIAAFFIIAVATTVTAWWLNRPHTASIDRIAVLPLDNLTGDPGQETFVQTAHEALIAELSRRTSLDVISRTSVMPFRDKAFSVPEIAARLDVDAVIEGSVARTGEKLTMTAQLIAANPERHLWAGRFHSDAGSLFEINTEIVTAIASEVAIELAPVEDIHKSAAMTVDREAYDAYALGRYYLEQRTAETSNLAQQQFRRALEIDPDFALAYTGLARTVGGPAIFGMANPAERFPEARRLAERANELDPNLPSAHFILGAVQFYWDWDWQGAERTFGHVLSLDRSYANAYRMLAEVYSVTGRHAEALAAVEQGRAIDPLPPIAQFKPSLILYLSRDFENALARAEAALEHYPTFWQGHWLVCLSLAALNQADNAIEPCNYAADYSGRTPMALGSLGYVLAGAGQQSRALEIARELEELSQRTFVGPASIAIIYGALRDQDRAFLLLEKAYELKDQILTHAENAAFFDPLRADARFLALRNHALATTVTAR